MVLGLSLATYTLIHVAISLVGIATGLIVLFNLMRGQDLRFWAAVFLLTTVLTSVSGFGFPFHQLMPSHIVGILSLLILAAAIAAYYQFKLAGPWRRTYVVCSTLALYFNAFVFVAQVFAKTPALKAISPTQSSPPFIIAQLVVMALIGYMGFAAVKGFQAQPAAVEPKIPVPT